MITNRAYILKKLEEAGGPFSGLEVDEGHLIATIGNLSLLLPVDMEPILRPLLGQKLGIIRVDSDYRHRVIKPTQNEHQSCDLENIAENIARARADQTRASGIRRATAKPQRPETRELAYAQNNM